MTIATRGAITIAVLCALLPTIAGTGMRQADASPCSAPRAVTALATGPGHALLAGTRGKGLYRSTDGGACWRPITTFPAKIQVGTLLVPPGHPNVIIAGPTYVASSTSNGSSVYRSDDGGRIWTSRTIGLPHIRILTFNSAVSPRTGTLVLSYFCPQDVAHADANLRCPRGLARSVDGGRTWGSVGPSAQFESEQGVVALADGTFLALQLPIGTESDGTNFVYRSRDDGRTWQVAARTPTAPDDFFTYTGISSFYAVPWDARRVFIGGDAQTRWALVFRSTDGGIHWSRPQHPGTRSGSIEGTVIAFTGVARTHTLLLSDLNRVYRSTDGGATWNRSNAGLPEGKDIATKTVWTLLASPDRSTVYAGTEGGVYASADDGRTWHATPS